MFKERKEIKKIGETSKSTALDGDKPMVGVCMIQWALLPQRVLRASINFSVLEAASNPSPHQMAKLVR